MMGDHKQAVTAGLRPQVVVDKLMAQGLLQIDDCPLLTPVLHFNRDLKGSVNGGYENVREVPTRYFRLTVHVIPSPAADFELLGKPLLDSVFVTGRFDNRSRRSVVSAE